MTADHPHAGQIVLPGNKRPGKSEHFSPIGKVMPQKNATGESLLACAICQCPSSQQQKKKVRKMQKRLANSRPKAEIPSPSARRGEQSLTFTSCCPYMASPRR